MFLRRLAVPGIAAAAAVLLAAGPASALPGFGTAPVSGGGSESGPQAVVTSVTVGHHAGFDRVVFSFRGPTPHYRISYVSQVIHDGSGAPVTLRGSAFLSVVLVPTSTEVHAPQATITPGFPMLKQVKGAGDFEAHASYGIGAASRSGFRAFNLTGPNRLVLDLAIPASSGSSGSGTGTGTGSGGSASGGSASGGSGTSGGGLAQTGTAYTVPLVLGGLGLVGVGASGLWLSRRRRLAG